MHDKGLGYYACGIPGSASCYLMREHTPPSCRHSFPHDHFPTELSVLHFLGVRCALLNFVHIPGGFSTPRHQAVRISMALLKGRILLLFTAHARTNGPFGRFVPGFSGSPDTLLGEF